MEGESFMTVKREEWNEKGGWMCTEAIMAGNWRHC